MRVFTLLAMGLWLGSAPLMAQATSAGAPDPRAVAPEEAAAAAKTNDALVMRPWELWNRKAMKPE